MVDQFQKLILPQTCSNCCDDGQIIKNTIYFLIPFYTKGEIVGGVMANSLAIATDAAHLLTDFASFMISLFAIYMASKPKSQRMNFGWHRQIIKVSSEQRILANKCESTKMMFVVRLFFATKKQSSRSLFEKVRQVAMFHSFASLFVCSLFAGNLNMQTIRL